MPDPRIQAHQRAEEEDEEEEEKEEEEQKEEEQQSCFCHGHCFSAWPVLQSMGPRQVAPP